MRGSLVCVVCESRKFPYSTVVVNCQWNTGSGSTVWRLPFSTKVVLIDCNKNGFREGNRRSPARVINSNKLIDRTHLQQYLQLGFEQSKMLYNKLIFLQDIQGGRDRFSVGGTNLRKAAEKI